MARKTTTAAPARRNLTAKVRNQITEMHDDGKSNAEIASACGISEAKVEATLAAAAEGKTLSEAAAAKLAEGATAAEVAEPVAKPAKAAKPSRVYRETDHTSVGVRLFGIRADGTVADLGPHGRNDFVPACDAYEKTGGEIFPTYVGAPMRNVWAIASGKK
jgi:hypothetical protein